MRSKRMGSRSAGVASVVYCLAVAGLLYVNAVTDVPYRPSALWVVGGILAASFIVGVLIGRWWAVLLPLVVAVLTAPTEVFGTWPTGGLIPAVGVGVVGVGMRKAFDVTRREGLAPSALTVALAASYVALAIALMVYLASRSGDEEGGEWLLGAFVAAHAAFGFAFGKWRALVLVLLLPILAIPVPLPEDAYEPLPAWFVMAVLGAPVGVAVMATGVGVRKALTRFRSTR